MSDATGRRRLTGLFWRLLSVPIYLKILGIGALVACIFGGALVYQIQTSLVREHYRILEQRVTSTIRLLATNLESPMIVGDVFPITQRIARIERDLAEVKYVVVRDAAGRVVADTFPRGVPPDVERMMVERVGDIQALAAGDELIFDAAYPILNGYAGSVQLGMSDALVTREVAGLLGSVFRTLLLCVGLGIVLAIGLTYVLTSPIHHLVGVADDIGRGNLAARATVFSSDEIGRLAVAFNRMASSLASHRSEVEEKEKERVSLIDKTIQAQEDERRTLARELHDEFGQSLLALLLQIRSAGGTSQMAPRLAAEMETKIRELIDEIGRLVHGMRPPILDDYGLDSALSRHVADMSRYLEVPIDYQYSSRPELGRLPSRVEVSLYRIAQEALTNVVRHAGASSASVVVLQQPHEVVLIVEDQGQGFDLGRVDPSATGRLGLTSMRERAALLGGSCAIESEPGRGTTVRVRVPLSVSDNADTPPDR